jgi:modulator of FtsH protease HflC
MRKFYIIAGIAITLLLIRLSYFTVDASEYAYVTVFGRMVAVHDGGGEDAGLHSGWPWPIQTIQRLDRRLQYFDLPATELLTPDREKKAIDKTLSVEAYVCWRIAGRDTVERFIQSLGTAERAQDLLKQRFNSQLGAEIGQMRMDDLINTSMLPDGQSRVEARMAELQHKLMAALQKPVLDEYGIELVDIRLRRFYHPPDVRKAIFERIESERKSKVVEYETAGKLEAQKIEIEAKKQADLRLDKAAADEDKLMRLAEAEAAGIRNEAHRRDPEFYALLKSLESVEKILSNKTFLLMSTRHSIFDVMRQMPRPQGLTAPKSDAKKDKKGGDE